MAGDRFFNRVDTTVVRVSDPVRAPSIGEGLEQAGRAAMGIADARAEAQDRIEASQFRMQVEEQRRQRAATIADRAGAWAETQARIAGGIDELRRTAKPGAAGYQEAAEKLLTDELTAFNGTLGDDPEVRERFGPIIASYGASARLDQQRFAIKSRTEYEGQRTGTWKDAAGNDLLAAPTVENLQRKMDEADLIVGGLDIDGNAQEELKRGIKRDFVNLFGQAQIDAGNAAGLKEVLTGGKLDTWLSPEDKMRLIGRADTAIEVAARQTEMAESRKRDEARDVAKAVEAKIDAGIVPDDQELRGARAALVASGADEAELIKFDALTIRTTVNRTYAAADPTVLRRDRDRIAAKRAAGTASEAEQVMLVQLDKLVDNADTKEAEQVRGLMGNGPAGKRQALGMLSGTPEARYAKAEKLEAGLGFVANLSGNAQAYALEGREIRKARPKDFGSDDEAKAVLTNMLGPVAAALGGQYDDVFDTARDIMVAGQARIGASGFSTDRMKEAVLMATGAQRRPNGVIQGGVQKVRGKPVQLPDGMSAPEFDAYLSRRDFSAAVYANGRPVQKADALASYRPEWVGDDTQGRPLYRFVDARGGELRKKGGNTLLMIVEAGR